MKVNANNLSLKNGYHDSIVPKISGQYEIDREKNKQNLQYNNINRPAQAISFGGSAVSIAHKLADKTGDLITGSKVFNNLTSFVSDNEATYNAIYALFIAGILKPLCIIKQKGKADKKDKQYIATKNFLQAFIGSFLGITIGGNLIKKGYDTMRNNIDILNVDENEKGISLSVAEFTDKKVRDIAKSAVKKENSSFGAKVSLAKSRFKEGKGINKITGFVSALVKKIKYKPSEDEIIAKSKELVQKATEHKSIFDKAPEFVKELKAEELKEYTNIFGKQKEYRSVMADGFESFWKGSSGSITSIMKAKIASWMLPGVVTFLFVKKGLDKLQEDETKKENDKIYSPLLVSNSFKKDMENFKDFSDKKENPLSFKGSLLDRGIDGFAKGLEKLAMSGFGQGCANTISKISKKPSARMGDLESFMLTGYWVASTTMSKKIAPDQKLGLNVNNVAVTVVSSATAFLIDLLLDPFVDFAKKSYNKQLTKATDDILEKIKLGEIINPAEALKQNCSKLYHIGGVAESLIEDGKMLEGADLAGAIKKASKTYAKHLSKFKSLTVFTLFVRFLVPVVMVETSARIKTFIKNKQKEKQEKELSNAQA